MEEFSIWEQGHKKRIMGDFGIAIGRIISVDATNRLCNVSTFAGQFPMAGQHLTRVQWLSTDSSPDGDESGCIPRVGSMGLVFFVGGEAFMWGFIRPLSKGGSAAPKADAPTLNEGDKIQSTKAGNRLTLKRSGLIEHYCKDTLQRLMMPVASKIADICRTYILKTDGGKIEWGATDAEGITVCHTAEYNNTVSRAVMIKELKGYVSSDVVYKREIGPGNLVALGVNTPVYLQTIKSTGEAATEIHLPMPAGSPAGYKSTIKPDGSLHIVAGATNTAWDLTVSTFGDTNLVINKLFEMNISKAGDLNMKTGAPGFPVSEIGVKSSGEISAKNKVAKLLIKPAGDIEFSNGSFSMKVSANGEMTIDVGPAAKATLKAGLGGLDVTSMGPLKIEANGPVDLKAKGMVKIDGGTGASDNVLTFPTTLSPFTGAPFPNFSTTVMVSK